MAGHRWLHAAILVVVVGLLYGLGTVLAPWRPVGAAPALSGLGPVLLSALLVIIGSRIGARLAAGHRQSRMAEIDAALAGGARSPGPARVRLRPEMRYRTRLALCAAAIVAGYALFGLWSLVAAPAPVWLHGVAIGVVGVVASGRPLRHGLMRMLRPSVVDVSREGLRLIGARPVEIAWDEIDRILVECGNGGLVLRFRLIDIGDTLARMAPVDRRLFEAEWRSGHPPISINLNAIEGSVGAQLQAIAALMPPYLPALNVSRPAVG